MGPVFIIGIINCHVSKKSNLDELLVVVKLVKVDICAVVETWFKRGEGKARMQEGLGDEYVWVGKDRKGRKGGGVGFLLKKGVEGRVAKQSKAEGLMWLEVGDEEGKFFIAVIYMAPGSFPKVQEINTELMDELSRDILVFSESGRVCIVGDFNCRIGELASRVMKGETERVYERKSKDKKVDKGGRNLVKFMNDHEIIIVNGVKKESSFTSVQTRGNTVIDYIMSDQEMFRKVRGMEIWEEEFSIISDHRMLTVEVEGKLRENVKERREEKSKEKRKEKKRKERKSKEMRKEKEKSDEKKGGWRRRFKDEHTFEEVCTEEMNRWKSECEERKIGSEEMWQRWLEAHNRVAEVTVGRYKKKKQRGWLKGEWDQGMFEAVKEKNRLRREMGRVEGEERNRVVEEYKEWRRVVKRIQAVKKKRVEAELNERLESFRGTKEREYWKWLKRLAGLEKKKEKELPEEVWLGDWVGRGEERKDVWNEAFSKLGKFDLEDKNFDRRAYEERKENVERWEGEEKKDGDKMIEELNKEIEMSEVDKALGKAERNKAAGEDGCINEILKGGEGAMKESLLMLCQSMWREERVPKDWERGIIVPIFKEGEKKNVDNYRGITLLSVVGKLYTSILNERLSKWLEKEKKLVEEQGGFRPGRSTTEQIFILKEVVLGRRRRKKKTFCCFLDIRKAYDTVCREGLWERLWGKGVRGKIWRVIKNLYSEVGSCVRLGEEKTEWFTLDIGLRQGCILSPVLFSVFIDGLAEEVKKVGGAKYGESVVSLLMFADDVVLVAESEKMLQKMLDAVFQYSRRYRFRFNRDKSSVMVFGQRKGREVKFYLGKTELGRVQEYKYLGLILDQNFSWKSQMRKIVDKARKRSRALCAMGVRDGVSVKAVLRGWEVLVRPVLEYGAEIWGEKEWKEVEAIQMEMGWRVLGVSKLTTKEVIQGELGLGKMSSRRIILRLKFWRKIIKLKKKNRLIYKIYKERREEFQEGGKRDKKNWCYWTWKFLKDLHLEHLWDNEKVEEEQNFDSLVKKLVRRKEEREWWEGMMKKSKLRLYRKIKDRLVLEDYVVELDRGSRRQLTMLRGGTNHLRIETGRWVGESEEERVCNVCLSQEVENEIHFLLGCPMYVRERVKMFERIRRECELEHIEEMNQDWQLNILIGIGWRNKERVIRDIVIEYIREANKIRSRYIK